MACALSALPIPTSGVERFAARTARTGRSLRTLIGASRRLRASARSASCRLPVAGTSVLWRFGAQPSQVFGGDADGWLPTGPRRPARASDWLTIRHGPGPVRHEAGGAA